MPNCLFMCFSTLIERPSSVTALRSRTRSTLGLPMQRPVPPTALSSVHEPFTPSPWPSSPKRRASGYGLPTLNATTALGKHAPLSGYMISTELHLVGMALLFPILGKPLRSFSTRLSCIVHRRKFCGSCPLSPSGWL